jgi:oligosaccharyltransferase complex subunit alpha (ribophorin I)
MLAAVILAALAASAASALQVTRAVRKVDASKHVVTSSTAYKLSALPENGVFRVAFPSEEAPFVSAVVARFEENGSSDNAQVLSVKKDLNFRGDAKAAEGWSYFAVDLKGRKSLGEKDEIVVDAVLTDALKPFPKEISQSEKQLVVFSTSAYIASPYAVAKQSTTVSLPSGGSSVIESVDLDTSSGASYKQEGSTVKYGPFKSEVEAYTAAPSKIHYANNHPFATFTNVIREVEVSMWGNVAVEEHYSLSHTGATLKHGFSRIDYQSKNWKGNSFHELTALLPLETTPNSDVIGNISTSNVRKDTKVGATVLEVSHSGHLVN